MEHDNITWILFDLGNVIVAYQPDHFSRITDALDISSEQMLDFFNSDQTYEKIATGKLSPEEFVDRFNQQFGCSIRPKHIVDWFGPEISEVIPQVPEIITLLKQKYALGILSNTFFGHWDYFMASELALQFDAPMASHLLGYSKPDHRIFQSAIKKINATPEEILFVDDTAANVESAKALGIKAFQAATSHEILSGLKKFGVLTDDDLNNFKRGK